MNRQKQVLENFEAANSIDKVQGFQNTKGKRKLEEGKINWKHASRNYLKHISQYREIDSLKDEDFLKSPMFSTERTPLK